MCTPTATPPRWLTVTHPEILRVDGKGRPTSHGSRQHADTSSPVFRGPQPTHHPGDGRALSRQSVCHRLADRQRAQHQHAGILFAGDAGANSRPSLQADYETIDTLNFAWGGDFWATAYDSFDQVVLPARYRPAFPSPGHLQDYHRFLAFSTARFQHDQVEILRATQSGLVHLPQSRRARGHRLPRPVLDRSRFRRLRHLSDAL